MKILTRILLGLLVIVVGIQFFRPELNINTTSQTAAIWRRFPVTEGLDTVLTASCKDCHSNNTTYPWYSHVQPVGWWLADHIGEGKEHCNFDEFLDYSPRQQYHAFEEIREMIERDEMPLPSYTLLHRDAVLSEENQMMILDWSDAMRDSLRNWYPPDSLERRRRPSTAPASE